MTEFNYRELQAWQVFENNPSEENYDLAKDALQTRFERTEESMDSEARRILPRLRDRDDEEEEYYQNQLADPEIFWKTFRESMGSDEQSSAGNDEVDESGMGPFDRALALFRRTPTYENYEKVLDEIDAEHEGDENQVGRMDMIMELNDVALQLPSADQIFDLSDVDESRALSRKRKFVPTSAEDVSDHIAKKGRLNESRPIIVNDSSDSDSDDNPYL